MKFFLSLFFVLFFFIGFGQGDFLVKSGSNYFYKGKGYKYKDLAPFYRQDEAANEIYIQGVQLRKRAASNGLKGLYLIGGGLLTILVGSSDSIQNLDITPESYAVIGTVAVLGGYIIGTIALTQRFKGDSRLRKAVDVFNFGVIEKNGYNQETTLHLGPTSNGIGLVLSF